MHFYNAYGLIIGSELLLPELLPSNESTDADIIVRTFDRSRSSIKENIDASDIIDMRSCRSYPNIGLFLTHQGREVVIEPAPGVDSRNIRSVLLGHIFGALLHQRGLLVLHGSAITIDGFAVVFLGPSGSGKSTAIASLIKNGNTIVADDIVAIDANGAVPFVYSASPQLKLWPDVAEAIGCDLSTLHYVIPTEKKYAIHLGSDFSLNPLPLKRVYLLDKGDTLKIKRLSPQESTIELVRNSKAVKSLCIRENISSHFIQCTNVARNIPVCRLTRPTSLDALKDFANEVERDVRMSGCNDDIKEGFEAKT